MDLEDVKKIIDLMETHGLSEIEIEDGNGKIRLKRDNGKEVIKEIVNVSQSGPNGSQASPAERPVQSDELEQQGGESGPDHIVSPLVGTFYRRPNPDSDPYVKVGDEVHEDTVVGIVEAMKVMNEIRAEKSGIIRKVLVDDAHPVEYMQPIFEIE